MSLAPQPSANATLSVAEEHQAYTAARRAAIIAAITEVFRQIDPASPVASWMAGMGEEVFARLAAGQEAAALEAVRHARRTLAAQALESSIPQVNAKAHAGIAADHRPLDTLINLAPLRVADQQRRGKSPKAAMKSGEEWLSMVVNTEVVDAERAASSSAITAARVRRARIRQALNTTTLSPEREADIARRLAARGGTDPAVERDDERGIPIEPRVPAVSGVSVGYVRMLTLPSCPDCIILAGRWYRWNDGFERHPNCDCVHIPAVEAIGEEICIDPSAYFESLSQPDRERIFGKANARAILDGADIFQVVNASRRKGAIYVADDGRRYTKEGTSKRSAANLHRRRHGMTPMSQRPTVWQIYRDAKGDRDAAVRLLRDYGYIL